MTTLVTGASGFVGSAVARLLEEKGHRVRALVRRQSDLTNLEGLSAERAYGDLRDPDSLSRALAGCSALFHVAADYRLWVRDTAELYASNVDGTRNIMRAALDRGVERIVYTSSVATLGSRPDGASSDEETPVAIEDMIGHYKRSKFLAEKVVEELVRTAGLPAVIVNPSTPVGPRDVKPTPTGRMIREAAHGRIPAFVDTGLNIVHVDDVAEGHWLAYEYGGVGRRYILGGDDLPLVEILGTVAARSGRPAPRFRVPRSMVFPAAYVAQLWADLTKGPEPQLTVDGLKMAKRKMYFSSARAARELGYRARPAVDALHAATDWFCGRGVTA